MNLEKLTEVVLWHVSKIKEKVAYCIILKLMFKLEETWVTGLTEWMVWEGKSLIEFFTHGRIGLRFTHGRITWAKVHTRNKKEKIGFWVPTLDSFGEIDQDECEKKVQFIPRGKFQGKQFLSFFSTFLNIS